MIRTLLIPLVFAICSVPSAAETWDIDQSHSHVGFKVRHLVIAKVRGQFTKYKGTVAFDEKNLETLKAEIEIDVASVDTRDAKRDKHLRSADFFHAEKFPTITFKSNRVKQIAPGKLEVFGVLTMKGVSKPVVLEVLGPSPEVKDPGGNPHRAFSLELEINRKDWGLTWDKQVEGTGAVVGDKIEIEIEIELKNKRP